MGFFGWSASDGLQRQQLQLVACGAGPVVEESRARQVEGKVGSGKRVPYARHRSTCRYFANSQNPDEHQSQDLQSAQKKGTDQETSAALCTAALNVTFALILIFATVSIVVVLIYRYCFQHMTIVAIPIVFQNNSM